MEALDLLEKEKQISREVLFDAIENSLIAACKNHFGKADNVKVEINRETCDFLCYAEKEVTDEVTDPATQISLADAKKVSKTAIAIAWILRHPAHMQAIAGTMNPEHLKDICDATKVTISHNEWYRLYLASGKFLP